MADGNYVSAQTVRTKRNNRHIKTVRPNRRRRKRRLFFVRAAALFLCLGMILALGSLLLRQIYFQDGPAGSYGQSGTRAEKGGGFSGFLDQSGSGRDFSKELEKLLELNAEARDYVEGYPERSSYIDGAIDLTEDFVSGQVPLLMQWDRRWGYDAYGDSMIGLAGCGPLCMTQAYLYFTEDTEMNPRKMADFAYDNGFYTSEGTSWSLWTDGAEKLGLSGRELPLDQSLMERALDAGELIVCSMGPGDFTTTGHFILIRGYDENGFYVNDPNRRSNSSRQWDFHTLQYQIRNLWALSRPD